MMRLNFIETNTLTKLNYVLLRDVMPQNPGNFAMGDPLDGNKKNYEDVTRIVFGPPPGVDLTVVNNGHYIYLKCYDGGEAVYLIKNIDSTTNTFTVSFYERNFGNYKVNLYQDYDIEFFEAVEDNATISFNDYLMLDAEPYMPFHFALEPYDVEYRNWSQVNKIKFHSSTDLQGAVPGLYMYLRYTSNDLQGRYLIVAVNQSTKVIDLLYVSDNGGQVQVSEQYDIFIQDDTPPAQKDGLNFPEEPKPGEKYYWNGVEYTWILVEQVVKPDRGFWLANAERPRPFLPIDLESLKRFPEDPSELDIDYGEYAYKIYKPNATGIIKVSDHLTIMAPLGNALTTDELKFPGEYYIYGDIAKFEGSTADFMFKNQTLRQDITVMSNFLKDCPNYTGLGGSTLPQWDMSHITLMDNMFSGATSFNEDIGGWNTARVESMDRMFYNATSFNTSIEDWCVRNILSRPVEFDIGSGFESQFDSQPDWGKCPVNEDGQYTLGNVTIVGPNNVQIETERTYTYTNDGNYQASDRGAVIEERWQINDGPVYETGVDLPFDVSIGNGNCDVKLSLYSPRVNDSPQSDVMQVYVDGTIDSISIQGPSIAKSPVETIYYIENIVPPILAGRVDFKWTLKKTNGQPVTSFLYEDISTEQDGTRIAAYFFNPGDYYLSVTHNGDSTFEDRKNVTVEGLDFDYTQHGVFGPDQVVQDSTEQFTLSLPVDYPVLSTTFSIDQALADYIPVTYTDPAALAVDVTFNYPTPPVGRKNLTINWQVLSPTGTLSFKKPVEVICKRRTATLVASTFTTRENLVIGKDPDKLYDDTNNFLEMDWIDPCCDKELIIDVDIMGGLYPEDDPLGIALKFAYPALKVMSGLEGNLLIRIEPGVKVTGGPGIANCWNHGLLHGDIFSDRPMTGQYCQGTIEVIIRNGGDGLPAIDVGGDMRSSITIQNYGTIKGGGGGGNVGGNGGYAATTECSGCTRGGLGGNGGWGEGGRAFTDNKQWWPNNSDVLKGQEGWGDGSFRGKSGAGGDGGQGGVLGVVGNNGMSGSSGSNNTINNNTCFTGGYTHVGSGGRPGPAIEGLTSRTQVTNYGTIDGEMNTYDNDLYLRKTQLESYLDSLDVDRETKIEMLKEMDEEVYEFMLDTLITSSVDRASNRKPTKNK